ncbi:MAG: hypothetical protein QM784_31645 [Polyangiaceae bacterium]
MARFVRVQSNSTSGTVDGRGQHRDGSGHLEPGHLRRLLRLAQGHHNPDGDPDSVRAFVAGRKTSEAIGEELAEAFLESATSGEPCELERLEQSHGGRRRWTIPDDLGRGGTGDGLRRNRR